MNVVLMLAHSIEEYQQVELLHSLGYNVFSIGAYIDPRAPGDDKRPALPQVPFHEDLARAVWSTPSQNGDTLWAAKDDLPQEVIDWGDVFICHHVEWRWITRNWSRLRDKRVIWRTVGQSTHENEFRMRAYRDEGLQVVRYSPREKNIPGYIGEDALIRFWVDQDHFSGWTGKEQFVANVTQDMKGRGAATGWDWFQLATKGLKVIPAGPKSDDWGGLGTLTYDGLAKYLADARCYLYVGTFPASYTLGLLEAMSAGVPIVAAGPTHWQTVFGALPYGHLLYEAHEIAGRTAETPKDANLMLADILKSRRLAEAISAEQLERIEREFSRQVVGRAWLDFLGRPG